MATVDYFRLAMTLARGQAVATAIERVAHRYVAGQCLCQEPNRFGFACPVHEVQGCCEGEHGV